MSGENILHEIAQSISELQDSGRLKELIHNALAQNIPVSKIIEEGIRKGLEIVGEKYEKAEYFLAELLFAGELVKECFEVLEPQLGQEKIKKRGIIVLGTVRGDIHDIGKNIFKMLAEAEGFEICDLGVDVAPESFINALKETSAKVLALSALLTTTVGQMKIVVDELNKALIRDKVKVLIGGNPVTKEFAQEIGAGEVAVTAS